MAYHKSIDYSHSQGAFAGTSPLNSDGKTLPDGEQLGIDGDESPDRQINFFKLANGALDELSRERAQPLSPRDRKSSLLTQALTSPELGPLSDIEAPVLTSDGGMTSPARTNTPSPPLPTLGPIHLDPIGSKGFLKEKRDQEPVKSSHDMGFDRTQEVKVEEELGRRRCISFACLQKNTPQASARKSAHELSHQSSIARTPTVPPKRPCMLRFACPMKPVRVISHEDLHAQERGRSGRTRTASQSDLELVEPSEPSLGKPLPINRVDHEASQGLKASKASKLATTSIISTSVNNHDRISQFNRIDFQKSEATRFHEFAGSFADEGEWANEQTAFRQKITINDTLRKENAIRKLAEEAEEEARDEEEEEFLESEVDPLDELSDEGNESDDEEGFAESDDESDGGSAYQFWTPSLNTATTSTDHLEHYHPVSRRSKSESSVESVVPTNIQKDKLSQTGGRESRKGGRMRKETPSNPSDLPDSSDFVVGTIDEDQFFEEQYLSRIKQKERAKQKLIPQDIDPSFPTSDPEGEEDDDEEVENLNDCEEEDTKSVENSTSRVPDILSSFEDDLAQHQSSPGATRTNQSPRRLHSPPPSRRLFGQAIHHFHSPPPLHRKLMSPPSSRRPSFSGSPDETRGISIARLAQRPNLTHTASLPRTPNPFWYLHGTSGSHKLRTPSAGTSPKTSYSTVQESHRRGPIEIVQGLENRRQRRKEKIWRQQCSRAHAGKEKERRCQPGKGAQRMREVGLVMADRFKGYKQDTKLVLSV